MMLAIAALTAILLKITFYNESITNILKISAAIFWLFILPGYCITIMWRKENRFLERLAISIPISTALLGITSYYLGLAGLNLKTQAWLLPAVIIAAVIINNMYLNHQNK